MDFFRKIFVWSFTDHEMTAGRENAPELSNIRVSRLWNVLENAVGKNEHKLTIDER